MQDILNKIKDECKAQGINLVNGSLKNYSKGNRFELSEDLDYKDLISIIKDIGCKLIVIDEDYFELNRFGIEDESSQIYKRYIKHNEELFNLKIFFAIEGIIYEKEWISDFFWKLQDDLDVDKEINLQSIQINKTTEDEATTKIADEIAKQDWYFKLRTRYDLCTVAIDDYLNKNNISLKNISYVWFRMSIDQILFKKYYKMHSEKLANEINELVKSGKTKIATIKELGITGGMFDKYK
jgi:hypothetical protein